MATWFTSSAPRSGEIGLSQDKSERFKNRSFASHNQFGTFYFYQIVPLIFSGEHFMKRLFLVMGVLPILMMGCGGDDEGDNNSTHFVGDSNSTTPPNEEWQLVKQEEDEGKDGSIDSTASLSYDANGRLINFHATDSVEGEVVESAVSFNYNTEGQWTTLDWEVSTPGIVVKMVSTLSYGVNGRLTEMRTDIGNNGSIEMITTFFYDVDGKLVREEEFDESGALEEVGTYIYDTSGRLAKTEKDTGGDGIIDDESIYTYDANGNLIKSEERDSIWHYTWQSGKLSLGKGIPIEWFLR
jgi:hypothetical protein